MTAAYGSQERLFVGRMIPIFNDDEALEFCAVLLRDATSTVRHAYMASAAEDQFRDFARATSDWFWETDKSLRIKTVSDRLNTMTGLNLEAVKGQRLDEIGAFEANFEGENRSATS